MGFFDRLREGLTRTKEQIVSRFEEIVQKADTAEQRARPSLTTQDSPLAQSESAWQPSLG